MPRIFFFLATSLFIAASVAQAKVDLRPRKPKVEDPGSATPLLYKDPQKVDSSAKPKIQVTGSCTDSMGMVVESTDKGFESCMRNNMNRTKAQTPASEKNPNSIGITIGN